MATFERITLLVFFYTLVAPAVPWLFARRRGPGAIWASTGAALLLLVLLTALLWPACVAANCGHGAIAVALMWGVAAFSAMVTLMVGGLMVFFRM
jgi:hypothetical protein